MEKLYAKIEELAPAYVQFWKEICQIETPSQDKAALDRLADKLQAHALKLGCVVYREAFEKAGDCLRIDLPGEKGREPVVLMAHMDTVHNVGSFGPEPVKLEDGILYGPGVNDCKNGITMIMLLLEAFQATGTNHPPVRVLFNSDEEVSAAFSGQKGIDFFETNARGAKVVLNCESGRNGQIVVGRKGIGHVTLEITGKAAHAGGFYFEGASAIREAAHKILDIEAMSQTGGNTFNCGVIRGGEKTNIVADRCTVQIDVRSLQVEGMEQALEQVRRIAERVYVPGTSCTMHVGAVRPPMEATPANYALAERINVMAAKLGMERLEPMISGGGSDAAYTTRMGIPTVCSIGPCGWDVHTLKERSDVATLPLRAKLVAKCICEL